MKARAVRLSKTFNDQLIEQIDYGEQHFGRRVDEEKKERVLSTISLLARIPALKRRHPDLGLVVYPISDTPFIVLYDYDENELRVHFIFRAGASLDDLDPTSAEW